MKKTTPGKKSVQNQRSAKSPPVSEETKAWVAALTSAVGSWPGVTARSFFGFTALYRKQKIFGVLPRTRNVEVANSLALKLEAPASDSLHQDPRIRVWSAESQKARWFTFELSSDADLHDALGWLEQAYEATAKHKKSK